MTHASDRHNNGSNNTLNKLEMSPLTKFGGIKIAAHDGKIECIYNGFSVF